MKTSVEADTLYLIPETDLVASRIESLRTFFAEEMASHPEASRIVLDVRGVETVDSLGVNLIVGLYREATAGSRAIEIVGANAKFMKVASFFRLPAIFTIHQEEAPS